MKREPFTQLPADPFGRVPPRGDTSDKPMGELHGQAISRSVTFNRQGRVELIGRAAEALMRGELPDEQSRVFLAAGICAWLQSSGGDLIRDHWKVGAPAGSHHTAPFIWRSSLGASSELDAPIINALQDNSSES